MSKTSKFSSPAAVAVHFAGVGLSGQKMNRRTELTQLTLADSRRFKEKNKSARANHNRKAGADKKASKGMF